MPPDAADGPSTAAAAAEAAGQAGADNGQDRHDLALDFEAPLTGDEH